MAETTLRCRRCNAAMLVWYDEATDIVLVGCRFRGCPMDPIGAARNNPTLLTVLAAGRDFPVVERGLPLCHPEVPRG